MVPPWRSAMCWQIGQSQAQAVGLGRHRIVVKVAVEQEGDLVLLDTAAGVGHGQADPSVDEFQLHGHRASGGGKLQGIGEQLVEQQLDGGLVKSAGCGSPAALRNSSWTFLSANRP